MAQRVRTFVHRIFENNARMFKRCLRTAIGKRLVIFPSTGSTSNATIKSATFVKTSLVPMSAKGRRRLARPSGRLVGLAERFLEDRLTDTLGSLKEPFLRCETKSAWEKRLTLSCTVEDLSVGDTVMLAGQDGPFTTHIKGLKRPQGMAEMRCGQALGQLRYR